MFRKVNIPILGLIENMSFFTPPDLPDRKYYIFGEGGGKKMAEAMDVDFEFDGEMSAEVALDQDLMARVYPFCRLSGAANVLIMPGLNSAASRPAAMTVPTLQ